MPWGAIASIAGSLIGANAAGGAADTAAAASDRATQAAIEERRRASAQMRTDLAPWRSTGEQANSTLARYLGLSGGGGSPIYGNDVPMSALPQSGRWRDIYSQVQRDMPSANGDVDTLAIRHEASRRYSDELAKEGQGDPTYGSLLKNFTGQDLASEPGYQFGLSEGEKGINRASAARGGYDSGSTLKALAKYNQDYAGTKYGDAYNRDAANKARIYGFLSGTSSSGQNAAAQVGNNDNSAAAGISGALMQNGANQANYGMTGAAGMNQAIQGGIGNLLYSQRTKPANSSIAMTPAATWNWDEV